MKMSLAYKLIRYFVFTILVLMFIFSVSVGLLTWKRPELVKKIISDLVPTPTATPILVKGIAVLGDSQSDEYRADDARGGDYSTTTMNWVELLASYRHLNFGSWVRNGEPRRTGYEYNFARTGATAYSLIASAQDTGAAELIKEGKVNAVVIYIGANDFAPYITQDGYQQIYDGTLTDAQVLEKVNNIVANITTAIEVMKDAGKASIILVKIPDWGAHLGVQVAFPFPDQRARVTQAIQSANDKLQKVADEYGIATIDPNAFYQDFVNAGYKVENVKLQLFVLNDDPKNVFLDDGIHMGTVLNGLFANKVIETLDTNYGAGIQEFSDSEILANAGIQQAKFSASK